MGSYLKKALAAGLAAATLSGGIAMPAMADDNANPPANGNGTAGSTRPPRRTSAN